MDVWAGLKLVWSWIKPTRFGVLLAGVLFALLVLGVGKKLGYTPTDMWQGAVLVMLLASFVFVLNNLHADPLLKKVMSWGLGLIILFAAARIMWKYTNAPNQD